MNTITVKDGTTIYYKDYQSRGRLSSGSTAGGPVLLTGSTTRSWFVFSIGSLQFRESAYLRSHSALVKDLVDGGVAAGKAATDEYIAKRYHQPSDEWLQNWDLRGEVMNIALLHRMGRSLADSRKWPAWQQGSEFKAIREKTRFVRLSSLH